MKCNSLDKYSTYRYKYFSGAGAEGRNLSVITESSLFFSSPSSFNDPFDCLPRKEERAPDAWLSTVRQLHADQPEFIEILKKHPHLKVFAKNPELMAEEMSRTLGSNFYENLANKMGVLCLTRDPVNELMWSHYGAHHKGFALEFDYALSLKLPMPTTLRECTYRLITVPVQYLTIRPHIDEEMKIGHQGSLSVFYAKSECWSYEKEERIVSSEGSGLYSYKPQLLKSIILGAYAEPDLRLSVGEAAEALERKSGHAVKIFQARLSDQSYKIFIPNHERFGDEAYAPVV